MSLEDPKINLFMQDDYQKNLVKIECNKQIIEKGQTNTQIHTYTDIATTRLTLPRADSVKILETTSGPIDMN